MIMCGTRTVGVAEWLHLSVGNIMQHWCCQCTTLLTCNKLHLCCHCATLQGRSYIWGNRGGRLGCFHDCCLSENKCSAAAEMGDHARAKRAKKWGLLYPFPWGRAGSPSNTMLPGPRSISVPGGILIHSAVWPQQTWSENWGLCTFCGGAAGSQSSAMWPASSPTTLPSGILIHTTVWPQYTNVTDGTHRQTGQTTVR